ncbi:hypothetical protein MTE2_4820 [Klebsiella pneumoniae VA360]|nr:hypothetical protein MTE2_4820 [Klebsiella pneumoniae VA360]
MSARRFGITYNPLKLINHRLSDADFIQIDLKPKRPGGVGHLPPFLNGHRIPQPLDHPLNCRHRSFSLMDPERITYCLPLSGFCPGFLPSINGESPGQVRQKLCRAFPRVPQVTQRHV